MRVAKSRSLADAALIKFRVPRSLAAAAGTVWERRVPFRTLLCICRRDECRLQIQCEYTRIHRLSLRGVRRASEERPDSRRN